MVNITVAVPEDMKKEMDSFAIINWSEVARRAFSEQLSQLHLLKKLTKTSKASEADVEELSKKIKKAVLKRHEERK